MPNHDANMPGMDGSELTWARIAEIAGPLKAEQARLNAQLRDLETRFRDQGYDVRLRWQGTDVVVTGPDTERFITDARYMRRFFREGERGG